MIFDIVSTNAPRISLFDDNDDYNMMVQSDVENLLISPVENLSKNYNLLKWFTDPNDIFLTYEAKAYPAKVGSETNETEIVTAKISGTTLTITLVRDDVIQTDITNVWVFARDSNGEYAKRRINISTADSPKSICCYAPSRYHTSGK